MYKVKIIHNVLKNFSLIYTLSLVERLQIGWFLTFEKRSAVFMQEGTYNGFRF